jgi:hypothetical protein
MNERMQLFVDESKRTRPGINYSAELQYVHVPQNEDSFFEIKFETPWYFE